MPYTQSDHPHIQMDNPFQSRRQDLVLTNKKRICQMVNIAIPVDHRKCGNNATRELNKLRNMQVILLNTLEHSKEL